MPLLVVVLGVSAMLAAVACGSSGAGASSPQRSARADFPYASYPSEIRSDCEIVVKRCDKCHTLDRVLVARVESREHWTLYVRRMRRMPGSGISAADADAAVNCLAYRSALQAGAEPEPATEPAPATAPAPEPAVEPTTEEDSP
ncbi:hypothetical protein Hoch_5045 [Haliangium ochraceum DSM 14365]|uniref:Cytochrome c domain-containing protein n=2 Tax=Haliangium ochraceum TaxID=80816 RepID=D0LVH2_HALO1|nr:hypothetical protein Hoch_5045 [Haliangium ochraceum DSM 14365]